MTCAHILLHDPETLQAPASRPQRLPDGPLGRPAISRDGRVLPGSSSFLALQASATAIGTRSIDARGNFVLKPDVGPSEEEEMIMAETTEAASRKLKSLRVLEGVITLE